MEKCKCIYVYKGDDTDWNGENLLTVHVTPASEGVDITSMTAKFILGSFEQTYSLADDGVFQVDLSAAATGDLPFGPINGTIRILDERGRIKTAVNTIPFYVTSEVITTQNQDLDFSLPEVSINVNVGGSVSYNNLSDKPTLNGVTIEGTKFSEDYHLASEQDIDNLQMQIDSLQPAGDYATQTQLEEGLATKQDVISDLAQIRSNAELGSSAVQPSTLTSALATKQDTLTANQLTAVNSGVDSVKVAQIATNATEISSIESKIPTQASASNQLADKAFVNSSINSLAAFYITSDAQGDPFATRAALVAGPWYFKGELRTPTLNDYSIVTKDETHDDKTSRFMYDGIQWVWQYDLNNTTFTAEQIAAINSGITSNLVTQIGTNESAITSLQNSKQDVIGDLSTIRSGAAAGATAVQPTDVATASTVGLVKPDGTTTTVNGEGTLSAVIPNNIWTQDNLKAGDNVTITQIEKPVIDSNTVELLHFNDDAIDSISNEALTSQIPTYSIGKFGKAAQNPTNFTIAFNTPVSFTKGNSYYTIDCWISSNASGDYNRKLKLLSSVSLDCINFGTNSVEIYRAFNNGSQDITVNYPNDITLEVGVWHHFALVGNGTQTLMFFDGKLFYSTSYTAGNESIAFYGFTGRMDVDELRVSNVARWTSNFTPYSAPYAPAGGATEYQINAVIPQISSAPTLTWYTGNTGTTVTIADTSSADLVKIYKNGILLEPTADYSISGTTLTMVTALVSTDKVTTEVF